MPEEKIEVIPNGIDLSEYTDLPSIGSFKKKFNIPENKKIIFYLGRTHRTKGIDFLVKAYAYLTKNMKYNDAILVIAGPNDGYLAKIKSLVDSFGLNDKVLFTDILFKEDKIKAYVDSEIITYLCPYESFGLVSLEAAGCRTPVIVANGTPMAHIVDEGKFGFSVKYGDINELAVIMSKMLNNEKLLREMGQRGRKFVFENHDWENIVTQFEKVYEESTK